MHTIPQKVDDSKNLFDTGGPEKKVRFLGGTVIKTK